MNYLTFNEDTLSRLLVVAKHHLMVSKENERYTISLKKNIPKSAKHFVATNIDNNEETVLRYNEISRVHVDFSVLHFN